MSQITATVTQSGKASGCMVSFSFDAKNSSLIGLLKSKDIETEAGLNVSQRSITATPKEAEGLISDFVQHGFLDKVDAEKIRANIARNQSLAGAREKAGSSPVLG